MAGAAQIHSHQLFSPEFSMRPLHLLCLLLAFAPAVPAAAQKSVGPSIVANVSDPQDADRAVFSPDGRVVALSGFRDDVSLWDLSSGLPIRTLPTRAAVTGSVFTSDGRRMLTGQKDGAVRLWDVELGVVLDAFRARPRRGESAPTAIIGLSIDAKGDNVITSEFGPAATVWNIPTRKFVVTVPRDDDEVLKNQSIAGSRISADGTQLTLLASKEYRALYSATVFNMKDGAELSRFDLPEHLIVLENGFVGDEEAIVLAPGDACPAGELMLFSLKDRTVVAPILRPAVCAKPKDDQQTADFKLHGSPDSRRVLISQEGNPDLLIFDAATRKPERTVRLPADSRSRVIGVSRDFRLAAFSEHDRIDIRSLDSGAVMKSLRSFAAPVDHISIGLDGAVVAQRERAGDSDAPLRVGIRERDEARGEAFSVALPVGFTIGASTAKARLALATNEGGEILLISLDGKFPPRSLAIAPLTAVARARLSPDGTAAVLDGTTKARGGKPDEQGEAASYIVNLADGKMTEVDIENTDSEVMSIAFSPDGKRFAFGFRDSSAEIFDAKTGALVKKLPGYTQDDFGDAGAIAFSPDGGLLAGGSIFDDKVFVWNIETGKLMRTMTLPDSLAGYRTVTAVAVSHDRKTLAAGLGQRAVSSGDTGREAGGIYLFDLATGRLRHTLRGHSTRIGGLAFSQDDRTLASASYDGTVRYWDRATGKPLATAAMDAQGRFAVVTEAGFFAAPEGGDDVVSLVRGTRAISGATARGALARPELVEAALKGDPGGKVAAAAKALDWSKLVPAR
jgi:WD40 repeat protein